MGNKIVLTNPWLAAPLVGSILVLPFLILEFRYGAVSFSNFPYSLFLVLWLLPTAFLLTLAPILGMTGTVRSGQDKPFAHRLTLVVRVAFLILLVVLWVSLIQDQLPCFLGVPTCD